MENNKSEFKATGIYFDGARANSITIQNLQHYGNSKIFN